MFYPLGWLAPDAQTSPVMPPPEPTPPEHRQTLLRSPLAWANGPTLATAPPRMTFSNSSHRNPSHRTPTLGEQASPVLRFGSQGDAVQQVQILLHQNNDYTGAIDGRFGPLTDAAVRQFQASAQIEVDGVVGPITWAKLRLLGEKEAVHAETARLPQPTVLPSPVAPSPAPQFAPSAPAPTTMHPIVIVPAAELPNWVWVISLTLGTAGLVSALGFRPDRFSLGNSQPNSASPIAAPNPIYPAQRRPSTPATVDLPSRPQTTPPGTTAQDHLAQDHLAQDTIPQPLSQSIAPQIPPHPSPDHLPNFLYNILQPYDRYDLETLLQHPQARRDRPETPPPLAGLLQRVGIFPDRNQRTGTPYTYLLLDDVGGCFRLCNNELWITHLACRWFQQEVPYTAIIRRLDPTGKVLDKEFTVALSPEQLVWEASAA